MKIETKYHYEKRIKELSEEKSMLSSYKFVALRIYDTAANHAGTGNSLDISWVMKQFRELLR